MAEESDVVLVLKIKNYKSAVAVVGDLRTCNSAIKVLSDLALYFQDAELKANRRKKKTFWKHIISVMFV